MKQLIKISILIFLIPAYCNGQDTDPGPGYQMTMINNPAISGGDGVGSIRLSYLNYYPGNNYNLHSVYFSYDSYVPGLHGGAAIYLSDDYLGGIVNDFRGGISYSYFLQAGKDFFINAGLSASIYHRGYNFDNAVLPDQIDPLGGISYASAEALTSPGRTVFDVGTGFLFYSGKITGGFSINHLAEPDLSSDGISNDKLKRKILVHVAGDLSLNKTGNLKARPIAYFSLQGGYFRSGAGIVLESNILSVNTIMSTDKSKNLNLQTGFSLKTGRMQVFYNYRFNIVSGNSLMPFSLLHQTGLAFSLNNVDKRNLIKTINFPKL